MHEEGALERQRRSGSSLISLQVGGKAERRECEKGVTKGRENEEKTCYRGRFEGWIQSRISSPTWQQLQSRQQRITGEQLSILTFTRTESPSTCHHLSTLTYMLQYKRLVENFPSDSKGEFSPTQHAFSLSLYSQIRNYYYYNLSLFLSCLCLVVSVCLFY